MKKLLFILAICLPAFAMGQTTIDRAMSVWARDIVNANFTEVYTNVTSNDVDIAANVVSIATNAADIDTLEAANAVSFMQVIVDSSETIALTEDTWAIVENATSTLWTSSGAGVTANGDSVTIVTAGDYFVSLSLSFKATADDSIQVAVFKNGGRATAPAETQLIGTETANLAVSGLLLDLVAGDDLSVRIQNTASGDDASVKNGSLVLYMLKPD